MAIHEKPESHPQTIADAYHFRMVLAVINVFALAAAGGCRSCHWLARNGLDGARLTRPLTLIAPRSFPVMVRKNRWANLEFSLPAEMRFNGSPRITLVPRGKWKGRPAYIQAAIELRPHCSHHPSLRLTYYPHRPVIADVVRTFNKSRLRECVPNVNQFVASFKSSLDLWNQTYTLTSASEQLANCRRGRLRGLFLAKVLSGAELCPFRLDTPAIHAYLGENRHLGVCFAELFDLTGADCGTFRIISRGKSRTRLPILMHYCIEILSSAKLVPYRRIRGRQAAATRR